MNPFELRGPEFLLFYLALGFTVLGVVVLRRRVMEPKGTLRERLADPLAIAYLRGGPGAAVSVAALDLLERRALAANEGTLTLVPDTPLAKPAPLERAILVAAEAPATFRSLLRNAGVKRELDVLRDGLIAQGLLPDSTHKVARWLSALTGLGLLAGVAGSKIHTALELGKSNIGFLILMWIGFTALLAWKASPRRTPRGERTLKDLGALLSRVRTVPPAERREDVATPAYATNDLLLMAALFGMTALPGSVQEAYGRALPRTNDATSGSGCGAIPDGGSRGDGGGGDGDGGGAGCGGCGGGGD